MLKRENLLRFSCEKPLLDDLEPSRDRELAPRHKWTVHCTDPHVLAEVSNLTDLDGNEGIRARQVLKETISLLAEIPVSSAEAALEPSFAGLGLAEASIVTVARKHLCAVLTDDLDLYLRLQRDGLTGINFTHLRARDLET